MDEFTASSGNIHDTLDHPPPIAPPKDCFHLEPKFVATTNMTKKGNFWRAYLDNTFISIHERLTWPKM